MRVSVLLLRRYWWFASFERGKPPPYARPGTGQRATGDRRPVAAHPRTRPRPQTHENSNETRQSDATTSQTQAQQSAQPLVVSELAAGRADGSCTQGALAPCHKPAVGCTLPRQISNQRRHQQTPHGNSDKHLVQGQQSNKAAQKRQSTATASKCSPWNKQGRTGGARTRGGASRRWA